MSLLERILSDLAGTLKTKFKIGNYVLWKGSSDSLEARDYDDTGYIDLKSQRIILDNNSGKTLTIDVDFASSGGYVPEFDIKEYAIAFDTVSPKLLTTVDEGKRVKKVAILIEQVFDGTATLSVGHTGNANGLMSVTDNDPTTTGYYEVLPNFKYGGADQIKFYLGGTSATGSGYVFLEIENTL